MAGIPGKTENRDGYSFLGKWDDVMHNCATCKYKDSDRSEEPCESCGLLRKGWENRFNKRGE